MITENPIHLWTYTSNLAMAWTNSFRFGALDHFWSLAIEEQFYLVWPIMVFFISPQKLAKVALILATIFVIARVGCSIGNIGEVTEKMFTLFRCEGLLMGAMAAVFVRQHSDITGYRLPIRIAFAISSILFVLMLPLGGKDFTIRYTVVSLVWVTLLLSVLSASKGMLERRFFEATPLRVLGKYSYAMYIFQTPLIPLLSAAISPAILTSALGGRLLGGFAYVISMFAITFALAVLSWHCLEKWCLRLRDHS
jgi:peptidoglycan/LPS O-acetylase OafA/YrhL